MSHIKRGGGLPSTVRRTSGQWKIFQTKLQQHLASTNILSPTSKTSPNSFYLSGGRPDSGGGGGERVAGEPRPGGGPDRRGRPLPDHAGGGPGVRGVPPGQEHRHLQQSSAHGQRERINKAPSQAKCNYGCIPQESQSENGLTISFNQRRI